MQLGSRWSKRQNFIATSKKLISKKLFDSSISNQKRELKLIKRKRIVLRKYNETITMCFAGRLVVLENKINHLNRSCPPSRSKLKIIKELANDSCTLVHDIIQLIEVCNGIGTNRNLLFTTIANWLGGMEADIDMGSDNIQISNTRTRSRKNKKTQTAQLLHHINHTETTNEENCDDFKLE